MKTWARTKLAIRLFGVGATVLALHTLTTVVLARRPPGLEGAIVGYTVVALAAWVLGALWLIERSILRPLRKLHDELDHVSSLDFVPDAASSDLVAELSRGISRMASRVREDAARLAVKADELQTARQNLTRAEQLALVGQLSAGLAHEIGNPLGAIMGYVKLLDDEENRTSRQELTARIDTELQRIHRLVRELLDFARPTPMKLQPVELSEITSQAATMLSHQPRTRHVKVVVNVDRTLVFADMDRLKQVILNLLLNAAEAMPGGGTIVISKRENGEQIALVVSDEGPGFSPAALERATEPFFTTKPTGSGLGLAVCASLVTRMGGQLVLGNAPTGGAAITVSLRRAA